MFRISYLLLGSMLIKDQLLVVREHVDHCVQDQLPVVREHVDHGFKDDPQGENVCFRTDPIQSTRAG